MGGKGLHLDDILVDRDFIEAVEIERRWRDRGFCNCYCDARRQ
jgi:hypothetical protein